MSEHIQKMTAQALLRTIRENEIYSDSELIELLGPERHSISLSVLENALTRSGRLRPQRLSQLKSEASGYPAAEDVSAGIREAMPEDVSRATGALVIKSEPLIVGMVEDTPKAIAILKEGLRKPYEIQVLRLDQFKEAHRAAYIGSEQKISNRLGDIYSIFDMMAERGASDLHIGVGTVPAVRVDGDLEPLPVEPPDPEWMREEVLRIAGPERSAIAEKTHNVDFAFSFGDSRYRVNVGADQNGPTIAARKIPGKVPTMSSLGLPHSIQNLTDLPRGLVLVTGPTGSGKSTTLAALLQHIASNYPKHIITLEDPVEFPLRSELSTVHQRELGSSFTSFADGLRQALRQDPDVVLVGEMRDIETIRTALTAAETGHLVFGTLHTYDAASTVARVVSAFPADEQDQVRGLLSHILKAIVSQALLPRAQGGGRVAAFEVLLSNPAISANLIRVDGQAQIRQTMEVSLREGMQTMDIALAELVRRRTVTLESALLKSSDPEELQKRIDK